MYTTILLLLTLGTGKTGNDVAIDVTCETLEFNHYWSEETGKLILSQAILWGYIGGEYHIIGWTYLRDEEQRVGPKYPLRIAPVKLGDRYRWRFSHSWRTYQVTANTFFESYTPFDTEREESIRRMNSRMRPFESWWEYGDPEIKKLFSR